MTTPPTDPARKPKRYGLVVQGYALEFAHETGAWPIELTQKVKGRRQKVEVIRTRRTVATLLAVAPVLGAPDEVVARGEAYCSPSDTYDKEAGRQLALYDLLPGLPKEKKVSEPRHRGDAIGVGRALIRAYCSRPGGLPWAVDGQGKLEPWRLEAARTEDQLGTVVKVGRAIVGIGR